MNNQNIENIIKDLDISTITKNIILTKYNQIPETNNPISLRLKKMKEKFNDDRIWKIFINDIINSLIYEKKNWYISIKIFIQKFYENMINYLDKKHLINNCKFAIDVIDEIFPIEKIVLTNNYRHTTIHAWCAKLHLDDVQTLLKQKHSHDIYNKPRNWVFIDEKNVYLTDDFNKSLLSNGKFIQNSHIKALYNKNFVDIINNLQTIYHKIDINLFVKTFQNNNLLNFYQKKDKYNKQIDDTYYSTLLSNFKKYKFNSEIDFIKNLDKTNLIEYTTFIDNKKAEISPSEKIILNFIYNYNGEKIYNNLVCDYRGRIYIQNIISYISSKLYRFLITLNENIQPNINDLYKYYIACVYSKNVKSINNGVEIYNNLEKNYNINNVYKSHLFNKIYNFKNYTISLDATSSMLQIISLIAKDYKLMKYTNLIPNNDKLDIYDYIISILNSEYKDNLLINHYTNRNLVKYSIMLYIYGSTPLFTAEKLNKEFELKTIYFKDLTTIINNIIKTFKNEFQSVVILKKIINKYLSHTKNDETTIIKSLIKSIEYSCPQKKRVVIKTNKIYTEFYTDSDKPSILKKRKSTFVNIIHTLDSEICIMTRNNLLNKGIYTLSIHDCFITHINNYKELLNEYNKNLFYIYKLSILDIIPKIKDIMEEDKNFKNFILKFLNQMESFKNQNIDHSKCYYTLKPE